MMERNTSSRLQYVTWGGQFSSKISNKITFFHYDIRAG